MLTADQEREYRNLKEEFKETENYTTWAKRLEKLALILIAIAFPLILLDYYVLKTVILLQIGIFFLMTSIVFVYFLSDFLRRLAERHLPTTDKLVLLHTYSIINSLDCYFDKNLADTPELENKYRNKAIASAEALLSVLRKKWTVGDFNFGKKVLGETVSSFIDNIENRLLSNIEKGDTETLLKKANDILWHFSTFLKSPDSTPEDLERINERISKDLAPIALGEESLTVRASAFIRSHTIARDVIAVSLITVFCISMALLGVNYFEIPLTTTWIAFWALWGVLFVGYLNYIRKKKE